MQNSALTITSITGRMDAVRPLPMAWHDLGSTMLGWIGRRAALPGIDEPICALRPRVAGSGESRMAGTVRGLSGQGTLGASVSGQCTPRDKLEALYQAWRSAVDGACRRQILGAITQAFTPLIRSCIRQYHVASVAGRADLEQEAFLGLHEALTKYDPARGVTLAGFVRWRIIGAILDARRKWFRQCRGHDACPGTAEARHISVLRTKAPLAAANSASDDVEFEDLFNAVGRCLSAREKLIVRMMVLDGKTCRQIGRCIGLHHARVGQVYRNAIETLRHNPRARGLLAGRN
jgi:RNA polymerase sigma factor (sigma-70 family)